MGQTVVDNPLKTAYGSFSIIGDSYSTFYGYTDPVSNGQWYPHLGVTKLNQTWWKLLEAETGMKLEQNNSWSGTTICNTSWNGNIDTENSFVGRCDDLRQAGLIIVEGGTNDNNAGSPIGSYVYENWTEYDLRTFRGGTAYVLSYLQKKYPESQVVFMLNNGLRDDINTSVETICKRLDVPLFKINSISKEDDHPSISGMVQIKDQFVKFLNTLTNRTTMAQERVYPVPQESRTENISLRLPLEKDKWKGLCLPFDLDAGMVEKAFGKDAELAAYGSVEGSAMKFVSTREVRAGVPFLVRPSVNVDRPICIDNVTLPSQSAQTLGNGEYSIVGTYRRTSVMDTDAAKLLLDGDGSLYRQPDGYAVVLPFEVYFKRPDDAPMTIEIDGFTARIPQKPDAALFSPVRDVALHAPSVPLVAVDPNLSVWAGADNLYASTTRHWSGSDKSLTGYVRVDGQIYRFLGDNSSELDVENVILPSSYWTPAERYTVPSMVFKKATPGTTDQVQGVPPVDAMGRNWYASDYELTDGEQAWSEATSPFSSDKSVHGQPSFQWTTDGVSADIYFRRTFTLDKELADKVYLACGHDDSPSEIYINGTKINVSHAHADGWYNPEMYQLTDEEAALIRTDGTPNVIAVHVHNNYGGAFADCGLYGTKEFGDNIFAAVDTEAWPESGDLTARQLSVDVLPTQTYYTFEAGPVSLDVVFSSPQVVTDAEMLSTPVNFVSYQIRSKDGLEHDVKVYFSTTPQFASLVSGEPTTTTVMRENGLLFGKSGSDAQTMSAGNRQNWGYAYMAADPMENQVVGVTGVQQMVFRHDMGTTASDAGFMMIGFDDNLRAINMNGYEYPAYWTTRYRSVTDAFADYAGRYNDIMQGLREFDGRVYEDALKSGGEQYAELCALAYRQVVAGSKLAVNNDGKMLMYNIDNNMTGQINSADVCYAAAPMLLSYNPQMAVAMVEAVRDYIRVTNFRSPFGNPPHHLGVYPMIGATGLDNGADTSSSFVIVAGAAAKAAGNADGISEDLYGQLKDWADFCDLFTLPEYEANFPAEGSCDTYAGVNINDNANLRAKCAIAMAAMAEIARLKGRTADVEKYTAIARRWTADWMARYVADGGKYPQGSNVGWGQKYNLFYDRLLGSGLFGAVINSEMDYYVSCQRKAYGMPMDARWDNVSKLHETMMTAAMASSPDLFSQLVADCYKYVDGARGNNPLSDVYDCVDGSPIGGSGRPMVGMLWAKVLMDKVDSGGVTDIDGVGVTDIDDGGDSSMVYNLNGQCVGSNLQGLPAGVYIVGNRKVVVR